MESPESAPVPAMQPVVPPVVVNMPRPRGWVRNIGRLILALSIVLNIVLIAKLAGEPPSPEFSEKWYSGPRDSAEKIALIRLDAVIDMEVAEAISRQIKMAVEDENVKAIVLEIDTPGGGITASDLLYHVVAEADKKKPVIAMMESVAASGGYYVAVGCRRIFAQQTTVTGSIGVLAVLPNIQKLLSEKLGIEVKVLTAGEGKDTGSMFREMTIAEEKEIQDLINGAYDRFTSVVTGERANLTKEKLTELGAHVFVGPDAVEKGLVDEIGYRQAALDYAKSVGGFAGEPKVVRYGPFYKFGMMFVMGQGGQPKIDVQVGPDLSIFRHGPLLYLWQPGFPAVAARE